MEIIFLEQAEKERVAAEFRRQLITRLNDEIQKLDTLQQQQREILQQCNEAQSALENYLATLEL